MTKEERWKDQLLVSDKAMDADGSVAEQRVLYVCRSGNRLFRENFVNGEFAGKNMIDYAYDFIVTLSELSPHGGKFYDVSFVRDGATHHALVQMVKPEEELNIVFNAPQIVNQIGLTCTNFTYEESIVDQVWFGHCVGKNFRFLACKASTAQCTMREYGSRYGEGKVEIDIYNAKRFHWETDIDVEPEKHYYEL